MRATLAIGPRRMKTDPFYGRAKSQPMLCEIETERTERNRNDNSCAVVSQSDVGGKKQSNQTVFRGGQCLELYHTPPDPGERRYKFMT